MKIRINRDHFSHALQQVFNIVGSRTSIPILGNVLVEAERDKIILTTTNLDLAIRCQCTAEVEISGGITLPVRKLATIVRSLPNMEVRIDASLQNQAKITSGSSKYRIMSMEKKHFPPLPTLPDTNGITLSQDDLARMIRCVSYAQSVDESRKVLNGMYLGVQENKIICAATNGKRLALCSSEAKVSDKALEAVVIPARTVIELQRLLGQGKEVTLFFTERQINFLLQIDEKVKGVGLLGSTSLISKVIEGKFPNYQQIIPKQTEHRIKLEREFFQECVQRAALVTDDRYNSVMLTLANNTLDIKAWSPDVGESHETMAIVYDGPEVGVAFDPQYILDPLKALTEDQVFFEFKDKLSPGVIKTNGDFICVIMPLQIKAEAEKVEAIVS